MNGNVFTAFISQCDRQSAEQLKQGRVSGSAPAGVTSSMLDSSTIISVTDCLCIDPAKTPNLKEY